MQFILEGYRPSHRIANSNMNIYPYLKLVTDDFDDYGYQTLFRIYYVKDMYSSEIFIGKIKILHKIDSITRHQLPTNFKTLNSDFCSLGQSTAYYEEMKRFNNSVKEIGRDILSALNDIAIFPDIKNSFPNKSGIQNSLERDSEAYHALNVGHNIFYNKSSEIEGEVSFKFQFNKNYTRKVSFTFNDVKELPNRINLIVGKNGTGKTKILSTLASILSGYSKDSNCTVDIRPDFSRYIAISYSAFDDFEEPFGINTSMGEFVEEKERICNEIQKLADKCKHRIGDSKDHFDTLYHFFEDWLSKTQEYVSEQDLEEYFDELKNDVYSEDNAESENKIGSYVYCGLKHQDRMITEEEMFSSLSIKLDNIVRRSRTVIWNEVISEIFDDKQIVENLISNDKVNKIPIARESFNKLSSGQKIVLYIFTEVIESITGDSLLLIDEPEIHLHPNAISSFMRMLNKLLDIYHSFAIIATHSPIILQEIPSKYVRVFDNNEAYDETLYNECFGDNISKIISDVFDVRADESNYKSYFIEKKKKGYSKAQILKLFQDNLSMNAKLYLNCLYEGEAET